jgi:hypothetical protein
MTTEEKVAQAFLGLRKYFCELETKRRNAMKYDIPCRYDTEVQKQILFHLFVYESLDCFTTDELKTLMSMSKRISRNCGTCSVSEQEIADWLLTDEGILITSKIPS